jgi:FKBP-type peptidyl-prolyl cis-trans isomerase
MIRFRKNLGLGLLLISTLIVTSCKDFVTSDLEKNREKNIQTINDLNTNLGLNLKVSDKGVYYRKTVENTNGLTIDGKKEVQIAFSIKTLGGVTIASKTAADNAIVNFYLTDAIPGLFYSMILLKEGEKGEFYVTSDLAYQDSPPTGLDKWAVVKIELEIVKVFSEEERIAQYLTKNKLVADKTTSSGLKLVYLTKNPVGDSLKTGNSVKVNYKGSFLTDGVFDQGAFDMVLGTTNVIKGFEEGIRLLRVGEKARVFFPSAIGYGSNGSSTTIPPYMPLQFEIEIVSKQ